MLHHDQCSFWSIIVYNLPAMGDWGSRDPIYQLPREVTVYHCPLPPPPPAPAPAVLIAVILTATWPSTWPCPVLQLQGVDNATEIVCTCPDVKHTHTNTSIHLHLSRWDELTTRMNPLACWHCSCTAAVSSAPSSSLPWLYGDTSLFTRPDKPDTAACCSAL